MTLIPLTGTAIYRWPGISSIHQAHHLILCTHLSRSLSSHRSIPTMNPTSETSGQQSEKPAKTCIQPPRRRGRNNTRGSRNGQGSSHSVTDNGANTTNPMSSSTQHMPHHKEAHDPSPIIGSRQNRHQEHKSTHKEATSTQHSFHNRQWRTTDKQQQQQIRIPSQPDTEGLTQALGQLTTEDNGQATASATRPTNSRFRTAKPTKQAGNNPGTNTETQSSKTKTRLKINRGSRKASNNKPPQDKRGTLFDLLTVHLQSRKECMIHSQQGW